MIQTIRDRDNSRRVRTPENNSGETVRRLGTIIQSIFCAQSGASIRLNFWKQFGESRYPGALSPLLENFCPAFSPDPTGSLWVSGSEDACTVELPMEASCASEKNGHFSSPYSYRRLCQFAIIRTNEPTGGLVNTVSCGSRKHREEWTNQNAWKRPFCADWVILPLLPATPATLVHPVRTNPDIFETAYFFTWIGPLTTQSQWFRSFIRSLCAYKMCGFKYIRGCVWTETWLQSQSNGRWTVSWRWVKRKKKWKFLISTSVSVHNNARQ